MIEGATPVQLLRSFEHDQMNGGRVMPTVRIPDSGHEIEERRQSPGRRLEDYDRTPSHLRHRTGFTPLAAVWALIGAIVVLYLFFVAFGGVNPDKAPAASITVAVLA